MLQLFLVLSGVGDEYHVVEDIEVGLQSNLLLLVHQPYFGFKH